MPPPNGQWILGDLFGKDYGHAGNIKILWETRWKMAAQRSVYPFHDGTYSDFETIFESQLIPQGINDPFSDAYTQPFLHEAKRLIKEAHATSQKDVEVVKKLYLRANAVLRIGRFPYIDTDLKKELFDLQTKTYLEGCKLWDVPVEEVVIPHKHAEAADGKDIPLYVRKPKSTAPITGSNGTSNGNNNGTTKKFPVILLITGLDGHRPDNTERTTAHLERGWATVICDIPGTTSDCPADRKDPLSPDRLFSSILDWIAEQADLDSSKIIAWGLSAGGYYAIRLAFTHHERLRAAVGHGAGTHYYIGREWLSHVGRHEYPFGLERAYTGKYGYSSFDEMMDKCQKEYSLVSSNVPGVAVLADAENQCCKLLLINGELDGCMPVEDSYLVRDGGEVNVQGGTTKQIEGRKNVDVEIVKGRLHMGYPEANGIVYPWMENVMA